jgi:c-di-GMP-binding flagellar brake protein YcgR
MTTEQPPGAQPEERIRRTPLEIEHILRILESRNVPITAHLHAGELLFKSRLYVVDPVGACIIIAPSADEAANAALLSRARCTFFASPMGGQVEFVATDPQQIRHEGKPAIRFKFPDVLSDRQRREHDRASVSTQIPLECLADAGGVLSFKGGLVDISVGGLGFLIYDPGITLEPGTVLKGCRIGPQDDSPLILDLEVRYSEMISLADGTRAERAGCRVVVGPETLKEFVEGLSR